jgi:hypothetical protein
MDKAGRRMRYLYLSGVVMTRTTVKRSHYQGALVTTMSTRSRHVLSTPFKGESTFTSVLTHMCIFVPGVGKGRRGKDYRFIWKWRAVCRAWNMNLTTCDLLWIGKMMA